MENNESQQQPPEKPKGIVQTIYSASQGSVNPQNMVAKRKGTCVSCLKKVKDK